MDVLTYRVDFNYFSYLLDHPYEGLYSKPRVFKNLHISPGLDMLVRNINGFMLQLHKPYFFCNSTNFSLVYDTSSIAKAFVKLSIAFAVSPLAT